MSPDHPHGFRVRAAAWSADGAKRRRPWADTVATFATLAEAEADALARAISAWTAPGFDPFAFDAGCLFYLSSLPDEVLCDWLLDYGVDPPDYRVTWSDWHRRTTLDPLVMMTALDKLRLFDVAEAWPAAHLVADATDAEWWWHTDHPDWSGTTGEPRRVCADRAAADAHAAAVLADATRDVPDDVYVHPSEVVRVVPVEARARSFDGRAFLLTRAPGETAAVAQSTRAIVPVAVYGDAATAASAVAGLLADARRKLNPFATFTRGPTEAFMDALFLADVAVTYRQPWVQFNDNGAAWYDTEQAQLTDADRAVIWSQFTDPPLYAVTEIDFDGAA